MHIVHFESRSTRSPRPVTKQTLLAAAAMTAVLAAMPAQVAPGLQFAELGKRHLPLDVDQTSCVAYGDVDGDGDLIFAQAVIVHWPTDIRLTNVTADVMIR